jgi:hypothetical protein
MDPALAPVLGAALTAAACYATGALMLNALGVSLKRLEKFPLGFVLGAACLHLILFALLTLKIAYRPVLLAVLTGLIVAAGLAGAWRGRKAGPAGDPGPGNTRWDPSMLGFAILFGVFTVFYFVNAWAPETSADGAGYHLDFVARYLRAHGFERITTNMYATLSEGVELLFIPAFGIGRHSAAALVHFSFAVVLTLEIFAYGNRIGRPWAGAAAALLTYLSPVVGKDATSAYIDMGVAATAFSVFYWLEIWDEQRDARLLIPIGLLAGYAYAAKYTAFVMLLYALGFVAWKTCTVKPSMKPWAILRPLLVLGACAAVMMVPWIIKNRIYVQNPVAPLANQIFRNAYFHVLTEQEWSGYLRRYGVENLWTLPLELTLRGAKTQGVIGPVFLAAPLALLALRFRAGRRLLVAGLLLLSTYFMNVGTRFLIPCLPFFSLAMALALTNAKVLLGLLVLIQAVTAWPRELRQYTDRGAWRLEHFPLQAALRKIPEDQYLRRATDFYAVARMIEENVPPGERVLAENAGGQSYTSREILVAYEASLNRMLSDALEAGWIEDYQPTRMFAFRFPERRVRRIRFVETAKGQGPQQWSVHELRFRHAGAELPRESTWRLRAFPNPWEVQLAFDNSPVTKWSSWETARPGMYIDVDFGRAEMVDEADLETSRAYEWPIQLQAEAMNEAGRWVKIAEKPEERAIRARGSLRRAATYEMHQRGVNYLLVGDRDYGSENFRSDPESWGLATVARVNGVTLYKVAP